MITLIALSCFTIACVLVAIMYLLDWISQDLHELVTHVKKIGLKI